MKNSTKGLLYLINWATFERQIIQFVPMEVDAPRSASITKEKVVGRNQPVIQFGGGEQTLSLTLDLYGEDVRSRVEWLMQFTMNDDDGNPPPLLKVMWDTLIQSDALWSVESVNPKYSLFMPGENFAPRQATVSLTLVRNTDRNITFIDTNRF